MPTQIKVPAVGESIKSVYVADWKKNTGYAEASLAVSFTTACFWHAMEHVLLPAERVEILRFATGLSTPPAGSHAGARAFGPTRPACIAVAFRGATAPFASKREYRKAVANGEGSR